MRTVVYTVWVDVEDYNEGPGLPEEAPSWEDITRVLVREFGLPLEVEVTDTGGLPAIGSSVC